MSSTPTSISTEKAEISITPGNLVRILIFENVEIDLDDIRKINAAKNELTAGKQHVVLFFAPRLGSMNVEALEFSASEEANKNAIAKAIVVSSLTGRLISNFFVRAKKPPVPTKVFGTEKEALAWLQEQTQRPED